jgi:quercetin dioxygenase-like cupin family protein
MDDPTIINPKGIERIVPISIAPMIIFKYFGVNVATYHASKGQGLPKHQHTYNHGTICHAGSCIIRKAGKEMILTKKTGLVDLAANEWHEIEALEDDTVFQNIMDGNALTYEELA